MVAKTLAQRSFVTLCESLMYYTSTTIIDSVKFPLSSKTAAIEREKRVVDNVVLTKQFFHIWAYIKRKALQTRNLLFDRDECSTQSSKHIASLNV